MIKTVYIYLRKKPEYNSYYDIDNYIDKFYNIKGVKEVSYKGVDNDKYRFDIQVPWYAKNYVDEQIFKKFPKCAIFNNH